jgi:cation diffusion facilitator CzcD-associated flavoprotein CzcO
MPDAAVYKTTHMVSSKRRSHFVDAPMPPDYPDYPSHAQVMDYFRGYAARHGLSARIELGKSVVRAVPAEGGWSVGVAGEDTPRQYRGLVVANGHHSTPHLPAFQGTFAGESVHSRDCHNPDRFEGKRVVVVGCGNSGCDIAADLTHKAARVVHSMRRGYYIIPKYICGCPSDVLIDRIERWPVPQVIQHTICQRLLTIYNGPFDILGLQTPDHNLFETHPVISQLYTHYVSHGKIHPALNIDRFEGNTVVFVDGKREEADVIIYATGFEISVPFLDRSALFDEQGAVTPLMNIFHPELENLFFIGLIQVNGGAGWPVMDRQAELVARYIAGKPEKEQRRQWFDRVAQAGRRFRSKAFVKSQRHSIEVGRTRYQRALAGLIAALP